MTITKYEHACLWLDNNGEQLVIDPGMFAKNLPRPSNLQAIVITHIHGDHLDLDNIKQLLSAKQVPIYGPQEVVDELAKNNVTTTAVDGGQKQTAGSFQLEFFGGEHALIHSSYPAAQNVGVMVNDTLYYPGDSFTKPDKPVKILATPANAPWMRVGEAMDFITAVQAERAFPTHNSLLSEDGQNFTNNWLKTASEAAGVKYEPLVVGEPTEL